MEEDMKEDDDLSANIKEYLESSPFEVPPPSPSPPPPELTHPRSTTSQATKKSS
jgi:hypothetical protein